MRILNFIEKMLLLLIICICIVAITGAVVLPLDIIESEIAGEEDSDLNILKRVAALEDVDFSIISKEREVNLEIFAGKEDTDLNILRIFDKEYLDLNILAGKEDTDLNIL